MEDGMGFPPLSGDVWLMVMAVSLISAWLTRRQLKQVADLLKQHIALMKKR
jgi:hypothetical protein